MPTGLGSSLPGRVWSSSTRAAGGSSTTLTKWQRCSRGGAGPLSWSRPFEMELRYRRHDGEYRWMLARVVPLRVLTDSCSIGWEPR